MELGEELIVDIFIDRLRMFDKSGEVYRKLFGKEPPPPIPWMIPPEKLFR